MMMRDNLTSVKGSLAPDAKAYQGGRIMSEISNTLEDLSGRIESAMVRL